MSQLILIKRLLHLFHSALQLREETVIRILVGIPERIAHDLAALIVKMRYLIVARIHILFIKIRMLRWRSLGTPQQVAVTQLSGGAEQTRKLIWYGQRLARRFESFVCLLQFRVFDFVILALKELLIFTKSFDIFADFAVQISHFVFVRILTTRVIFQSSYLLFLLFDLKLFQQVFTFFDEHFFEI